MLRRAREEGSNTDADTGGGSELSGGKNATAAVNGTNSSAQQAIVVSKDWCGADGLPDVRVPRRVMDAASEWLVQRVEGVCEVVDDE